MTGIGVALIGGEMVTWTDDDLSRDRIPAGGPLLLELLKRALPQGARVLVAGPHQTALVDEIVAGSRHVTLLLRSVPDAEAAAARHPDSPVLSVVCGGLDKFTAEQSYDAIVALDGMDRLGSADGADLSWAEGLTRLTRMLGPEGLLLFASENELGVHRLVDPFTGRDDGDNEWRPAFGYDATRPADPDALSAALGREGLSVQGRYAGYPLPRTPAALIGLARFEDAAGLVGTLVSASCAQGYADREVLADPRRLARDVLRTGLGGRLAPQWFMVARRSGPAVAAMPEILVADNEQGRVWEVSRDGAGHVRRPLDTTPWASGRVSREVPTSPQAVPSGITLEELLLEVCAHEDLPRLRELLRSFAGWLVRQEPEIRPFATTDNVVFDGVRFAVLSPGMRLSEPVPVELALARILRGFAVRLIAGGYRHPWPDWQGIDSMVLIWLSMAGHAVDRSVAKSAIALEAEITAALRGLTAEEEAELAATLAAGDVRVEIRGQRELRAESDRLRRELEAAAGHAEGLRRTLDRRDEVLAEREKQLAAAKEQVQVQKAKVKALRASMTYRVGHALVAPPTKLRRIMRRTSAGPGTNQEQR